jgi:hypothetical protein
MSESFADDSEMKGKHITGSISDIQSVASVSLSSPPIIASPRSILKHSDPKRLSRTVSDTSNLTRKTDKTSPPRGINKYIRTSRIQEEEWSDDDESKLFDVMTKAKKYYHLYLECSKRYHNFDTGIMIPTLILNAMIISMNSLSISNQPYVFPIQITTIICTLIMTVCYSIEKKFKFSKKAEQYHSLAISFLECAQSASLVLSVPRKMRKTPVKCIYDLHAEQNKLLKVVMYIPSHIEKDYSDHKDEILEAIPV